MFGSCCPHRSGRRLLAHLVRDSQSSETVAAPAVATAAAALERPEFTMAPKVQPREGMTRVTETPSLGVFVTSHFTPAHTHPPLPSPPRARSPAAAAAVTTTGPPSCNLTLSAFLFLLQQAHTGCPSRGYGGRRAQNTSLAPLHALPEPRGWKRWLGGRFALRWEGLSRLPSLWARLLRGISVGGRLSRAPRSPCAA